MVSILLVVFLNYLRLKRKLRIADEKNEKSKELLDLFSNNNEFQFLMIKSLIRKHGSPLMNRGKFI